MNQQSGKSAQWPGRTPDQSTRAGAENMDRRDQEPWGGGSEQERVVMAHGPGAPSSQSMDDVAGSNKSETKCESFNCGISSRINHIITIF